jgi:hypothetical protein
MALMFMDSKEKNDLKEIIKELKNNSAQIDNEGMKIIEKVYNL